MERIPKWFKTRSILLFSKTVRYFDSREADMRREVLMGTRGAERA